MAREVAQREGWPWAEPVSVVRYTTFWRAKVRWHIMTNANCCGGNVNVHIDDSTREVIAKGYARR